MNVTPNTKIGWIGTGVMGLSMCHRLIEAGYNLFVYNRTKSKTETLISSGAHWCNSPKEVAIQCDIIFTIVGYPNDVEEVYFDQDGIFSGCKEGVILVDMTTTKPSLAKKIFREAKFLSATSIDAPVSGGDIGAKNGKLSIMVGGEKSAVDSIMPLLNIMGANIVYEGAAGSGQHTKMCNQITIAGTMIGVCESLLYAHKAGLNPETVLEAISGGAAGCWTLNNLAPRINKRDFEAGFYVEHFIKDMEIALDECRTMNLSLPGLALVHQLYKSVEAQGYGRKGTQALSLALEQLSNI
jgi:3-hydroxyisobutyrate dehydrogenase